MEQVIEVMTKMWQKAKIVHADFSEFNILYFQKRVWVCYYPRMPTYDTPTYDTFFENFQNVISWHISDFENEKKGK